MINFAGLLLLLESVVSKSFKRIDNASVALSPVDANNITYVFNLKSEHPFKILMISFLSMASLYLNTVFGNLTFSLNFLGLISISLYSRKVFTVIILSLNGPGKFLQPESMAVDSLNNIYVAEYSGKNIQKFDSNGNFIKMWGKLGSEKGQFVHLHDVSIDSKDNVYVTDGRENSRVEVFDSNGKFTQMWGSEGKNIGQFIEDHGIVTDSDANVYVVDTRNVRVQKFDSNGNFITMWGSLGCKDDQFLIPHDIAIDSEGKIYVTDSGKSHFRANYDCN
jgi:DNA-binding beta-propeller fold protein YncE